MSLASDNSVLILPMVIRTAAAARASPVSMFDTLIDSNTDFSYDTETIPEKFVSAVVFSGFLTIIVRGLL